MLSGDNENEDDAYQLGEKITNDHYDRFVAVARTANMAECPAQAGTSRKWAAKWIKVLEELAIDESDAIQKLMTASAANPRKLFQGDVRLSAI